MISLLPLSPISWTALVCTLLALGLPGTLWAVSPPDTLRKPVTYALRAGILATAAQRDALPLWLVANRFGKIRDRKNDLSAYAGGSLSYRPAANLSAEGRLDLYANNHFGNLFVQQGYVKFNFKKWQVRGGRYEEIIGDVHPTLSSGSLGVSGNALPIPRVGLATTGYVAVPFTGGWLQFKGRYSHGWLERDAYVQNAFLHEKSFYLRIGKEQWGIYGGGNHFAQWAGTHPAGRLPDGLGNYLHIVLGRRGSNGPIAPDQPLDAANAPGNHLICFDFGLYVKVDKSSFRLYTQSLFEKGSAPSATVKDQPRGFKLLSPDRLVGLQWIGSAGPLRGVVLEFISTRYQGGPEFYVGRDNYYNHSVYRTGWSYQGQIVGTPLFLNQARAAAHGLKPGTDQNIVSNRIVGGHLGVKGQLPLQTEWRTLVSWVRHYGNYFNTATFTPARWQGHLLQEFSGKLGTRFTLTGAVGYDFGELSANWGGQLGLGWVLPGSF